MTAQVRVLPAIRPKSMGVVLARRLQTDPGSSATPATLRSLNICRKREEWIMFKSRILTSTMVAATLLTAAPVLAEESNRATEPLPVPACCERVQAHVEERAPGVTEGDGAARDARQRAGGGDEDPFQRRPYWNGP